MYVLDTSVIAELIKKSSDERVLNFLSSMDINRFFLSVLTLGDLRKSIERLEDSSHKQKIIQWLKTDFLDRFYGRIIMIDANIAEKGGYICAHTFVSEREGLIAASALAYNHKLVVRNSQDFYGISGLEVINPWEKA